MTFTVATAFLLFSTIVAAGSVHFFVDKNFGTSSGHWVYKLNQSQLCVNMGIFDNKTSSVKWEGLPQTDQTQIAFYWDENCDGRVRTWKTFDTDFPSDFARYGLDKQISSFMLWDGTYKVMDIVSAPRFIE